MSELLPHAAYAAGETIYAQNQSAELVYEVIDGMARTVLLSKDGRRMVQSFFAPGEVFGITRAQAYASAAEAVCDTTVARCERLRLEARALVDPAAATSVCGWLLLDRERAAARLSLLAHARATERISCFLFEMVERLGEAHRVRLPMSRYDIGDYLGLSSETVSRAFTVLRERGLIATQGRQVVMLSPEGLRRLHTAPT